MPAFGLNATQEQQTFLNNVTQSNQQNCSSSASTTQDNNVTIITGTTILGDFIEQSATIVTDSTCLISSSMDSSVESLLSALANQSNKPSSSIFDALSLSAGINLTQTKQKVTNNIGQLNEAACNSSAIVSQSGNYTYISDSFLGGNYVGQSSSSNPSSSCSMSNYMKNVTYTQAQAQATQNNTTTSLLGIITAVVVIVIVVIIILVVISFGKGVLRSPPPPSAGGTDQDALPPALAAQLGLPPGSDLNTLSAVNMATGGPGASGISSSLGGASSRGLPSSANLEELEEL